MTANPTRKQLRAMADESLFTPPAPRQLLRGLGEVVNRRVPLADIEPNPNQPRAMVDVTSQEFEELVGSIRQQGLIQPISLWQVDEDQERYVIIAGERRWRAFRHLAEENPSEYSRIPASITILRGEDSQAKALMMALVENVVREDLKPGERANALQRLYEQTGWSWNEIADRMGLGFQRIMELKAIARHDALREAVDAGVITQKQGTIVGQAFDAGQTEVVSELLPAIEGRSPEETRQLTQAVKRSDRALLPSQRVARGIAVLDARAPEEVVERIPVTRNGRTIGTIDSRLVIIANTPLGALLRRRKVDRAELAQVIQATCEELGIWPQKPKRSRPSEDGATVAPVGESQVTLEPDLTNPDTVAE
jgi:ParB/RepB/Spo0J family partition protein